MYVSVYTMTCVQMTRLGRIVNSARRKMPDKSLAKRMKKLVKQWQKLAVGSTPVINGALSTRSTPSPAKPIPSTNRNIDTNYVGGPPRSSIPLSYDSKPAMPTSLSTVSTPRLPQSSLAYNRLEQATPINPHAHQVNGQNNGDLVISLPLKRFSKQHKEQTLDCTTPPALEHPESPVTSLIVKLPLRLIRLPWEQQTTHPLIPLPTQLIVSIQLSVLKNIPDESISRMSFLSPKAVSSLQQTTKQVLPKPVSSTGKAIRLAPPLDGFKGQIPSDSIEGVNGCLGNDECWHTWEECIPSVGGAVAVLPYVYIDGLTGYDEEQTWCSLDMTELTNVLEYP